MNTKIPISSPSAEAAPQALTIALPTATATRRFGERLGKKLRPGDILGLDGPLGAGKTSLVAGIARGLGAPAPATSPTFTLVNEYRGRLPLYHVDLYRLQGAGELAELGLWELAESGGVMAVEWLSRFPGALPGDRLQIEIAFGEPKGRTLTISARGPRSREILESLA